MAPYLFQFRELFSALYDVESLSAAPMLAEWSLQNRAILEPYRKF